MKLERVQAKNMEAESRIWNKKRGRVCVYGKARISVCVYVCVCVREKER